MTDFVSRLHPSDIRARFGHPVAVGGLHALLVSDEPDRRSFGGWRGGSLVGTAMLAALDDGQVELAVLVRSDMKRRRIGSALARFALSEAAGGGAHRVVAHVSYENRAARALLNSIGFVRASDIGPEMIFVFAFDGNCARGSMQPEGYESPYAEDSSARGWRS